MMIRLIRTPLVVFATLGVGLALAGPPSHAGKPHKSHKGAAAAHDKVKGKKGEAPAGFSAREASIIRDWFVDDANLAGLPPGLAKREALSPGLAKQLRRNGTLPPGLEKKLHPLPRSLADLLGPAPYGTRRVILGSDILILDERSSAIVDILTGVVRLGRTF